MKTTRLFRLAATALQALLFAACSSMKFTHVKPGQSARAALDAQNSPPPPASIVNMPGMLPTAASESVAHAPLPLPPPPVDIVPAPALPDPTGIGDQVADLYTRGVSAMKGGRTEEAITALEEAVKLDPSFTDAWNRLVLLYHGAGKQDKAIEAYKRAKQHSQPGGVGPGPSVPGGLGLLP